MYLCLLFYSSLNSQKFIRVILKAFIFFLQIEIIKLYFLKNKNFKLDKQNRRVLIYEFV